MLVVAAGLAAYGFSSGLGESNPRYYGDATVVVSCLVVGDICHHHSYALVEKTSIGVVIL